MKLAFIGLGVMGYPMAGHLQKAGHSVCVYNRTTAKAERWVAEFGGELALTPAEAARDAERVMLCVGNDDDVRTVVYGAQGVLAGMAAGSILIDHTTTSATLAEELAARCAEHDVPFLDAPVSGGQAGAEQGRLTIMVGGEAQDFAAAAPLFAPLGRATHVGPHGAGQLAKLANEMIVGITIGAVAEALLLAAKGGADMAKVREALGGGFADSRILQLHGQRMVERDFAPRGRMTVQLKDMRNALSTAQELGFDAPVTALLESLYAEAVAHGLDGLDQSGLFVELAHRNGMT